MYQNTTLTFGCTCPNCANTQFVSIEQFVFEKAIVCKECRNIYCHWEGNRFPVTVHADNKKINS